MRASLFIFCLLLVTILSACRPGHFEEQARSQTTEVFEIELIGSGLEESEAGHIIEVDFAVQDRLSQTRLANQDFFIELESPSESLSLRTHTVSASSKGNIELEILTSRKDYQLSGSESFELGLSSELVGQLNFIVELNYSRTNEPVLSLTRSKEQKEKLYREQREFTLQVLKLQELEQTQIRASLYQYSYRIEFRLIDSETEQAMTTACFSWRMRSPRQKNHGSSCTKEDGSFELLLKRNADIVKHATRYRTDIELTMGDPFYKPAQMFSLILEPGASSPVANFFTEEELHQNLVWQNRFQLSASDSSQYLDIDQAQIRRLASYGEAIQLDNPETMIPTRTEPLSLEFRAKVNRSNFSEEQASWLSINPWKVEARLQFVHLDKSMRKVQFSYDEVHFSEESSDKSIKHRNFEMGLPLYFSPQDAFVLSIRSPALNRLPWSHFLFDPQGNYLGPIDLQLEKRRAEGLDSWLLSKKDFLAKAWGEDYDDFSDLMEGAEPSEDEFAQFAQSIYRIRENPKPEATLLVDVFKVYRIAEIFDQSPQKALKQRLVLPSGQEVQQLKISFSAEFKKCFGFRFRDRELVSDIEWIQFDDHLSIVCEPENRTGLLEENFVVISPQKMIRGDWLSLPDSKEINTKWYRARTLVESVQFGLQLP